ncbi:MAG TPA: DMT family transporter [Bacteroidia bacterium]|nr:DMT family transporter [Bacteroidia bacterium]
MIYIILCILINTGLILIFRLFPRFGIDSFQAIVANYFIAAFLGYQIALESFNIIYIMNQDWLIYASILGLLFVSLFYLISVTTVVFGVSVASVANKMSIVIPVTLAVFLYKDALSLIQIVGIIIAMGAVVLVSYKNSEQTIKITQKWHFLLPLILFVGCGSIDALINFLQKKFTGPNASNEFILSTAFLIAAIGGSLAFLFMIILKKIKWHTKSIITGLFLGIPNFFSMYLVMKSLESNVMKASVFFPVNNMSIVVLGTLVSVLAFKEKLSKFNVIGIFLSVLAIVLIALL